MILVGQDLFFGALHLISISKHPCDPLDSLVTLVKAEIFRLIVLTISVVIHKKPHFLCSAKKCQRLCVP